MTHVSYFSRQKSAMLRAQGEILANNAAFLSFTVSVSSETDSQLGSQGILERQQRPRHPSTYWGSSEVRHLIDNTAYVWAH